jgi:hypothetical protein
VSAPTTGMLFGAAAGPATLTHANYQRLYLQHCGNNPRGEGRHTNGKVLRLPGGVFNESALSTRTETSHNVAGKYFLTAFAQCGPVLLQALLDRSIIAQLLTAKALRISPAGLLFLWPAHVTLCKR